MNRAPGGRAENNAPPRRPRPSTPTTAAPDGPGVAAARGAPTTTSQRQEQGEDKAMTLRKIPTKYGHRYTLDGKAVPGVTTLLSKGLPKPALPRWAAKSAAEYVADNLDAINGLPDRESVIATVKQSPWTQRDRAAVRGTDVHKLAEDLIHGREVEVPDHLADYVDGYVRWLDEWQPQPVLTEFVIGNRHWWYAGTSDVIYQLPDGERVLADFKTSAGVYGETACQTAAYRHAEFHLADDGTEVPVPEVDSLAVVHITTNGTHLYRVADPEAAWKDFLHIAWVGKAEDRIKAQIGEPAQPITSPETVA